MPRYVLEHRHRPRECGAVFASFKGHASPLRHRATLATCRSGGHAVWWTVDADSVDEALALLGPELAAGDVVLVKASRGAALEHVAQGLVERERE